MSIKDLFGRNFVPDKNEKELTEDIESSRNLKAQKARKDAFVPQIDYSNPFSFAKFGSANLYYKSAIDRIPDFYPYDGSDAEITEFYNKSLDIEKYIFDKRYPRTTGYATFSPASIAVSSKLTYHSVGYGVPSTPEYITLKGGPGVVTNKAQPLSKILPDENSSKFQFNNVYDDNLYVNAGLPSDYGSGTRLSNLRSNFDTGVTVEFWAVTGSDITPTQTDRQVFFDMWNEVVSSSTAQDYGRLRIEANVDPGGATSPFLITVQSGTLSASCLQISTSSIGSTSLSSSLSDWNHYAFVFQNSGSDFYAKLYVNGVLDDTNIYASTNIGELSPKNMQARIGALITAPSGAAEGGVLPTAYVGAGKLSGSLDEFRFWKVARDGQQIGRNWFTQIRGGVNTDISNTTLGFYYKFNEGITGTSSVDSVVLDYGGRVCNGAWTGYSTVSRNTGSAILSASAAIREYEDPIIYKNHPSVVSLKSELEEKGLYHDGQNSSQFINLIPSWVVEEAESKDNATGDSDLEKMAHIVGAYFDKLYLQITALPSFRHEQYTSASHKPLPFAQHLPQSLGLMTPEIMIDADVLDKFKDRSDSELYENELNDTKNLIYQNLYNSLTHIFKSKGTAASVRNVLRCFNVDDNLLYFKTYSDNQTYELDTNLKQTLKKKKRLNFNTASALHAVMYNDEDPSLSDSLSYITGAGEPAIPGAFPDGVAGAQDPYGLTVEASVHFPRFFPIKNSMDRYFLSSSLFGMQTVFTGSGAGYGGGTTSLTGAQDVANFQVFAVRDKESSKNVRFLLTSSFNPHPFDELTSSTYIGVYNAENWNLSVGLRPTKENPGFMSGSEDYAYEVVFRGYNNVLGTIRNQFEVSASIAAATGKNMIRSWKRLYVGAQNTNITGSNLHPSDVEFNSLKYWTQYVDNLSLKQHTVDRENAGISGSHQNISPFDSAATTHDIYNLNSLALNWHFGMITGSDSSGNFFSTDLSSGSTFVRDNFGWAGEIAGRPYPGKGAKFATSADYVVRNELTNEFKFIDPEVVTSDDMVHILTADDELYGLFDEVPKYIHTLEKSLYGAISEEILDYFAGAIDFNNVIGDPVNRYRGEYKGLETLRNIYFEKFGDLATVEAFTEYYKWFDDALSTIIQQVVPASAEFANDTYNTIESHVLERPKYKTQFPTLEFEAPEPEASALGVAAKSKKYEVGLFGGVPSSPRPTRLHKDYWKKRAQPGAEGIGSYEISSGDATIDEKRRQIRNIKWSRPAFSGSAINLTTVGGTIYRRNRLLATQFNGVVELGEFAVDGITNSKRATIKGGVNFPPNKSFAFAYASTYPAGPINTYGGIFVPTNVLLAHDKDLLAIEDLEQWNQDGNVGKKRHRIIGVIQGRDYDGDFTNYTNTKNTFAFPFNIMSGTIRGGIDEWISSSLSSSVTITNLHNDVYGTDLEKPMQGPFTEYAVGGHQSRHVPLNVSASHKGLLYSGFDDYRSRPEAWKLLLGYRGECDAGPRLSGAIGLVPADYPWPEANATDKPAYPMTASQKAVYYRDFIAKRPVNIRNIRMRTGSTILGNFEHNYQIVHSFDAYANPRQFIENQPALPAQTFQNNTTSSTQTRTILDIHRTDEGHFNFISEYNVGYLTGTTNNSVISTRFGTLGGPVTDGTGYRDFRSNTFSVYNTLSKRYPTVIKTSQPPSGTFSEPVGVGTAGTRVFDIHGRDVGLTSHYARHTARFGRDPVALPTISYDLGKSMYISTPSVYTYNYSSGLQAWWRLNEDVSSAGDVADSSGNGRSGTFAGASNRPAFSSTLFPNKYIQTGSCTFDGGGSADDGTSIGAAATWDAIIGNNTAGGSTERMTISSWIRPLSDGEGNFGRIIDFGSQDVAIFIGGESSGTAYIYYSARFTGALGTWRSTNRAITLSEWNHIAVTFDATSASNDPIIYVNGVAVAVTESSTPSGDYDGITTSDCFIGNINGGSRTFDGQLADVAVWNVILTANSIQALAQAGSVLYASSITATSVPEPGASYDQLPGFHKIHRNNICETRAISCDLIPFNSGAAIHNDRSLYFLEDPNDAGRSGPVLASADSGSIDFLTASFRGSDNKNGATISFWACPDSQFGDNQTLWSIGKAAATGAPLISIDKESNTNFVVDVRYRSTTTGFGGTQRQATYTVTGATALNDASWHHFAVTFQGTNGSLRSTQDSHDLVRIYIDGVHMTGAVVSMLNSGTVQSYDAQIDAPYDFKGFNASAGGIPKKSGSQIYVFGGQSSDAAAGSFNYTGALDQCSLWTRSLVASEISDIYNGGVPCDLTQSAPYLVDTTKLHAWYPLGDPSPTGISDDDAIRFGANGGEPLSGTNIIFDHSGEPLNNMYPVQKQGDNFTTAQMCFSSGSGDPAGTPMSTVRPDPLAGCTSTFAGLREDCTFAERPLFDNFNIQHQIPRDSRQYAWITASLQSTASWWHCGFTPRDFLFRSGSSYIEPLNFISASEEGSAIRTAGSQTRRFPTRAGGTKAFFAGNAVDVAQFLPQTFRLNTNVYEPLTSSTNTLGYPASTPLANESESTVQYVNTQEHVGSYGFIGTVAVPDDAGGDRVIGVADATAFNNLMWKRGNQYAGANWVRMRQGDHPILTHEKRTNKLSTMYMGNVQRDFDLPPLSLKGRPAYINMDYANAFSTSLGGLVELPDNVTLKTTYNNEMIGFNEQELDVFTELNFDSEVTPFEQLIAMRLDRNVNLNWILYSENLFPSTRREFISSSMTRVGYDNKFWRNDQETRVSGGAGVPNSVGALAYVDFDVVRRSITQSIWPLDAPLDFLDRTAPPIITSTASSDPASIGGLLWHTDGMQLYYGSSLIHSNSAGELQNTYSTYHFGVPATSSTNTSIVLSPFQFGVTSEVGQIQLVIRNGGLYARKHMLQSPLSAYSPVGISQSTNVLVPGIEANNFVLTQTGSGIGSLPITASLMTGSGEAAWEAGRMAGYLTTSNGDVGFVPAPSEPWYNDYDDFRYDIKTIAKGYAVVPEFRISEQISKYAKVGIDGQVFDYLEIPGTNLSSSQDTFYKDYSNSDFMKNFVDVKKMSDLKATEIRLTCKATIKFNPYKGFYPADRTLDLVSQFSRSYAESLTFTSLDSTGTDITAITNTALMQYSYARPVMQPLFAPGILYNSIKSGMAVDYPVITNGYKMFAQEVTGTAASGSNPYVVTGSPTNYMIAAANPTGSTGAGIGSAKYVSGAFWDFRVPFEAIMEPMRYINGVRFADMEVDPRTRLPILGGATASIASRAGSRLYEGISSNFFAEVGKFFLKDGEYTKLRSEGVDFGKKQFRAGEVYGARLRMRASYEGSRTYEFESGSDGTNYFYASNGARAFFKNFTSGTTPPASSIPGVSGAYELPQDPEKQPTFKQNFIMYSRPTAFGPAVSGRQDITLFGGASYTVPFRQRGHEFNLSASSFGVKDSLNGYNWGFTPPYYYGESWVDFIFRPSSSVDYDLARILKETQVIQRRYDAGSPMDGHKKVDGFYRRTLHRDQMTYVTENTGAHGAHFPSFGRNFTPYASENINDNAMQVDSCINLFGIELEAKERYDKFGNLISQDNESTGQRWVIQPKFETPMMNFADTGIRPLERHSVLGEVPTDPTKISVPAHFGSGSLAQGMWHQFGILPDSDDKGIFMEIGEIPREWLQNHYDVVTGSSLYNNYTPAEGPLVYKNMKSFADLCGFNENNSTVRLGDVANEQVIKEAVVAIPYIETGLKEGETQPAAQSGQSRKQFINIPQKRFEAALKNLEGSIEGDSLDTAGASIRRLVDQMQDYVLPPQFDFLNNRKISPIVMYMFEFKYTLDKDDLSYIWQNLAPRDYKNAAFEQESTAHTLMNTELLTEYNLLSNPNLRWMVFKVKQRGQTMYADMITRQVDQPNNQKEFSKDTSNNYPVKYNWPYDYVSIVETIIFDADVKYDRDKDKSFDAAKNKRNKQNQILDKKKRKRMQNVHMNELQEKNKIPNKGKMPPMGKMGKLKKGGGGNQGGGGGGAGGSGIVGY